MANYDFGIYEDQADQKKDNKYFIFRFLKRFF